VPRRHSQRIGRNRRCGWSVTCRPVRPRHPPDGDGSRSQYPRNKGSLWTCQGTSQADQWLSWRHRAESRRGVLAGIVGAPGVRPFGGERADAASSKCADRPPTTMPPAGLRPYHPDLASGGRGSRPGPGAPGCRQPTFRRAPEGRPDRARRGPGRTSGGALRLDPAAAARLGGACATGCPHRQVAAASSFGCNANCSRHIRNTSW
jgi:hypothetical protein